MSPFEARWHDVVKVALVGTARQTLAPGPLPALARDAHADAEASLLSEAAALALYRRAGRLPAHTDAPPPAPAPPETLPRCSPGAARLLAAFLDDPDLLDEWLALAARKRVRADEALLPDLLDRGRAQPDRRAALAAVLGERGRWLAAQRPEWRWAVGPPDERDWPTADRAERLALLRQLRATDPARGRALVESTFAEDDADDRAAFVAALADGLADPDEPFLEELALADRRKEVRAAAARLLVRLPRSRLAARMAARARPCLHGGSVTPPHAFDPDWARDGLEPTPPRGLGARAFWLQQLVAAAPLAIWGPPDRAVAAVRRGDWAELLVGAFAVAAARQRDAAWAEAVLRATPDLPDLYDVLPPARREALAVELGVLDAVRHLRHAWSERFSRAVVAALRGGGTVADLRAAERHVHPAVLAELATSPLVEARRALNQELAP
jgi:uncharacterized protein DUF5691